MILPEIKKRKLIIDDDLMLEVMRNNDMELPFAQGAHHKCLSVILITQNLYPVLNTPEP